LGPAVEGGLISGDGTWGLGSGRGVYGSEEGMGRVRRGRENEECMMKERKFFRIETWLFNDCTTVY